MSVSDCFVFSFLEYETKLLKVQVSKTEPSTFVVASFLQKAQKLSSQIDWVP